MHDCDPVLAKETTDAEKWTYIELNFPEIGSAIGKLETQTPPRLIASHLPVRYFERILHDKEGPKVILIIRNPKDTLVSTYHFYRMNAHLGNFSGTWDQFFEFHKKEQLMYEDFFKYYAGWMKYKDHPNVLFVKYEDLLKDHAGEIKKIAAHISKELTPAQIESVVHLSSFSHMGSEDYKRNRSEKLQDDISKFFRKGQVGDWQNYFNKEQNEFLDNQYKSILVPLGLTFDFV